MPSACSTCSNPNATLICSRCKTAYYCNAECQREHWKEHKKTCMQYKDDSAPEITLINDPSRIRNVAFVSGLQAGSTSLLQSMFNDDTMISNNDDHKQEDSFSKCVTTVSTKFVTIQHDVISCKDGHENSYSLNIMDVPSSLSFFGEAISSIVLSDGIIVVIDAMKGVGLATEKILKYALNYDMKPIIYFNKMDIILLEMDFSLDQIINNITQSIKQINDTCNEFKDTYDIDKLSPKVGKVAFGSALYQWGFTLETFAEFYSCKWSLSTKKLMRKFWGNNYYDPSTQKWTKQNVSGQLQTGFVQFILKPLKVIHDAIKNGQKDIYIPIIDSLGLNLNDMELAFINKSTDYRSILKLVLNRWLPISTTLRNVIVDHLPSPINASLNKCKKLYTGSWTESMNTPWIKNQIKNILTEFENGIYLFALEIICEYVFNQDETITSVTSFDAVRMSYCKSNGAIIMYITKMIPMQSNANKFIAIGRIFSGMLKKGQEIRIMGPEYKHGRKADLYVKPIEDIVVINGNNDPISISKCSAGNICGIVGIEKYLLKYGTLSNSENIHPLRPPSIRVPPLKAMIEPKNAADLPVLIESLKSLAKLDPTVHANVTKSGYHQIKCYDQQHLQKCKSDINRMMMQQKPNTEGLRFSEPYNSYRETIISTTGDANFEYPTYSNYSYKWRRCKEVICKSPNKHCRIYMHAEPLSDEFVEAVENSEIKLPALSETKQFARNLADNYHWEAIDARRIWSFGAAPEGLANCFVDVTKGVQYLNEIKDHVIAGFRLVSQRGILCNEPMRGIRFNLSDAKMNSDAIHRGAGQIIPPVRRACYGCQIASTPRFLEPYYLVDIMYMKPEIISGIFNTLHKRMAEVENMIDGIKGQTYYHIMAYLPVLEYVGLQDALKDIDDDIYCECWLSDWRVMKGCPMTDGTRSNKILLDLRKRKGMKVEIPQFTDYYDRI